ncbi:hypothetical protein CJA_3232 [Cellvibrio japonicus Ueda107]|uniref:Uncharacterized protein n=1 Tax=Cellvibrio japonicus (strain Ueda107) TaxID=498211 RepID=B3PEC9_CELJU|nr:hypothetical protein CJA_3232 [Cellvibrio japonicus Ueda107]
MNPDEIVSEQGGIVLVVRERPVQFIQAGTQATS